MSKVKQIDIYYVRIPLPAMMYPAWIPGFPQNDNRFALVRVLTESGIEGWSSAPVFGKEHAVVTELLGPHLIGEDATDIDAIQQRIREAAYLGYRNYWIEPAFWDIKGKIEGKPVCELLGGKPCKVKLYAQTGEIKNSTQRIEELERLYEAGFRSVKLTVHDMDEKADIEQITGVANAMKDKMDLHVDANQGWRMAMMAQAPLWDLDRAKRFADVCADVGIKSLEEPLPMDDYEGQCELSRYSRIPIAGGELHTYGYPELKMMIERNCYSIFTPDAMTCGGIAQVWKTVQEIKKHNLRYSAHTWLNGISFATNLQVMAASGFCATEELGYPLAWPGWSAKVNDMIIEKPFDITNGEVMTPNKPGLGFDINKKVLRKYGKRVSSMNPLKRMIFSLNSYGMKVSLEMDKVLKERKQAETKEK